MSCDEAKLLYLEETKTMIKNKLDPSHTVITDDTPFREYVDFIGNGNFAGEAKQEKYTTEIIQANSAAYADSGLYIAVSKTIPYKVVSNDAVLGKYKATYYSSSTYYLNVGEYMRIDLIQIFDLGTSVSTTNLTEFGRLKDVKIDGLEVWVKTSTIELV